MPIFGSKFRSRSFNIEICNCNMHILVKMRGKPHSYDQRLPKYHYHRFIIILSHFSHKWLFIGSKSRSGSFNIEICNSNVHILVKMRGKPRSYDQWLPNYQYYRFINVLSHFSHEWLFSAQILGQEPSISKFAIVMCTFRLK